MSFDGMFEILVLSRILDAAMDEPAAAEELVQRLVDDEIGSREHEKRERSHRASKPDTYTSVRRSWVNLAKRLVPKMLRACLLEETDGKLCVVPPRSLDAYARSRTAQVFGMESDRWRVYDAARVVLQTQPEIGVRAVSTYLKMTRPKNKRALADADVFEAMMWFALSERLFKMWFENIDTHERLSAADGMRLMSEDEGAAAKLLVPMFSAADLNMHEHRLRWLEERRWKITLDHGRPEQLPTASGTRTRFVHGGKQRSRQLRASAFTIEEAVEQLAEKSVCEVPNV